MLEKTYSSVAILRARDYEEAWGKAECLPPDELDWVLGQYEVFEVEEVQEQDGKSTSCRYTDR